MAIGHGKHMAGKGKGSAARPIPPQVHNTGNRPTMQFGNNRGPQRMGGGFLEGILAGAAARVVSNVVGTVSGEVSELISQKSDLYQQEQAQKAQLERQEQAQQAQIRREQQEREAKTRYYSVCPFCDGVNQGQKYCAYCDSSLAYFPDETDGTIK